MLETLNSVPWSTLEHAYGKADDVPDLLRALASSEQNIFINLDRSIVDREDLSAFLVGQNIFRNSL